MTEEFNTKTASSTQIVQYDPVSRASLFLLLLTWLSLILSLVGLGLSSYLSGTIHPKNPVQIHCDPSILSRVEEVMSKLKEASEKGKSK